MKVFLRIKGDCISARRQLRAGEVLPVEEIAERDRQILVGCGLAEVIERYEVPDPKPQVADPKPAVADPQPKETKTATKKKAAKK